MPADPKPRRGRPPLPPESRRDAPVLVRLTAGEREQVSAALAPDAVSDVARTLLLREARRRERAAR